MARTLIILNPHAAGGRAGKIWTQLEPLLWKHLGELVVAVTQRPEEIAEHLDQAQTIGINRVISIGGDGTNHALVNALAELNERYPDAPRMVYGNLPVGTGRDWARTIGIPLDIEAAALWIAQAQPRPTDVGLLTWDGQREHFLNISSVGISGVVASRVNKSPVRRPWTFLQASVQTIIDHAPQPMHILLDGQPWYDGKAYVVAIANGTTFGHGMKIAPQAQTQDGLFDVVLVEGVSRLHILSALWRVYLGSHLNHPEVHYQRAHEVQITSTAGVLKMELDGEPAAGHELRYQVQPGLIDMLS